MAISDEQIQENAHIIVQQLILHSECLGPALCGDALGLHRIYQEALQKIANSEASNVAESNSYGHQDTAPSFLKRQTTFQLSWFQYQPMDVLLFYTSLVRMLAYCSSEATNDNSSSNTVSGKGGREGGPALTSAPHCQGQDPVTRSTSRHKQSVITRTRNILQNLIKTEEIVGILSFKFDSMKEQTLRPSHKESVLLFLDRVYGISCPDLLLQLLSQAFLPDVKCALQLAQVCSEF